MTTTPTGRIESHDGVPRLVLERTFRAPIDDVWAAVTEPERMARWIGTWTGDPTTKRVEFTMGFEGEASAEDVEIRECDPPRRLAVTTYAEGQSWQLELDLSERDGVTTLVFSQPGLRPDEAPSAGPGWEYYLDRLVVVETGGDPATVVFDDYYPAMQDHYQAQLGPTE